MVEFGPTRVEGGRLVGLPLDGPISSMFGARDIAHHAAGHSGVDIAAPVGTIVRAPAPGLVVFTSRASSPSWWSPIWGASVVLRHEDGSHSLYAHLSDVGVTEGLQVARATILGRSGDTGRSTGPHLHWGHALATNPWIRRAEGVLDPLDSISAAPARPLARLSVDEVSSALGAVAAAAAEEASRQREQLETG